MASTVSRFGRARYFLRRFIVHGRIRVILQFVFTKLQSLFIQQTIFPYFVTFLPFKKSSYAYVIPKVTSPGEVGKSGLPTPPEKLSMGYGRTIEEWLESGQRHVEKMRGLLLDSGYQFERGHRILEWGCAAGRMLRCLEDVANKCEIWGTDINGDAL